jgi:hypothetical protein
MDKVGTRVNISNRLANAAEAWALAAEDHKLKAVKIREDAVDQAARMVFSDEAQRREVLGLDFQAAEWLAMAEDAQAGAFIRRVEVARTRALYLDDSDPIHNAVYADLHAAAIRMGRVLYEQRGLQPVVFTDGTAPDSWFEQVERRFEAIHGTPRSGFARAI